MTDSITAVEARQRLGEMLNRVALRGEEIVITRGGKPLARLAPFAVAAPVASGLDLRDAAGLGKAVWADVDAADYVAGERDAWD